MEPRFGFDFSRVRVHSGPAAEQSAQRVKANAYAVGHHVVFGAGRFAPGTHEGRRLLAHELVHVLQQDDHGPLIQRQPQTSASLLTPAAATVAVTDVTRRYDEDSIRSLEQFSSRTPDGVFDAGDAEAIAKLQQRLGLTPNGMVKVPLLDAMLSLVATTPADDPRRSAMIHLVVDHANLNVSGVLAVVSDPGVTTASASDTFPGGVSIIKIGNAGFASYRVMVAEIRKQLAARPVASPVTTVPAPVLTDATMQGLAITLNKNRLNDRRSIRLLQGALGSKVTGQWDVDLVRHIAARQQALGLTLSGGILWDSTLAAIGTEMIANGSLDAVLQLIVDFYDLDRSHAFNIVFNPNPPRATAEAQTLNLGGVGTPGVVHVYPLAFAKPFASLVHTVAHELGHIQQIIQGVGSLNVREFLSEGIEIESKGTPSELIESDSDIDLMIRGGQPVHAGFIQDAQRMLHFWSQMTSSEQQAHRQRYRVLRAIIINRLATEGSATQKTKLAPFITRLNNAG
jgi:peptidoglycan hydrolase-like protein with peptidoglycan-binding domain